MRRYQDLAFRVAYVLTGDATGAEDAAQTAFLKAWRALDRFETDPSLRDQTSRRGRALHASVKAHHARDRFRPTTPFRPWLLRIVANEARNRRAAAGRRSTLALSAVEDRPSEDTALAPEAAALAEERRRELLGALNTLGEDDRTVIAYRYFFDLSEAEMAVALGCARGTVKSRLSRALERLRHRFPAAAAGSGDLGTAAGQGVADG